MNTSVDALKTLFIRDLDRLATEIKAYTHEADLWVVDKEISNSAGNLCLHLCGNLQHFFGHLIGGSDYIRKREDEFSLKNIPKSELLELIETSKMAVAKALEGFDATLYDQKFPVELFGHPMTYAYFMIHLSGHLNYHLGQINYHRRLLADR